MSASYSFEKLRLTAMGKGDEVKISIRKFFEIKKALIILHMGLNFLLDVT